MKQLHSHIKILNITENDVNKKLIRILRHNKFLFPEEKRGIPKRYHLSFIYKKKQHDCSYTIGSKDGKSRSGILKLDPILYENQLQITPTSKIKIIQLSPNTYNIKKNNLSNFQIFLVEVFSFIQTLIQRMFFMTRK